MGGGTRDCTWTNPTQAQPARTLCLGRASQQRHMVAARSDTTRLSMPKRERFAAAAPRNRRPGQLQHQGRGRRHAKRGAASDGGEWQTAANRRHRRRTAQHRKPRSDEPSTAIKGPAARATPTRADFNSFNGASKPRPEHHEQPDAAAPEAPTKASEPASRSRSDNAVAAAQDQASMERVATQEAVEFIAEIVEEVAAAAVEPPRGGREGI